MKALKDAFIWPQEYLQGGSDINAKWFSTVNKNYAEVYMIKIMSELRIKNRSERDCEVT